MNLQFKFKGKKFTIEYNAIRKVAIVKDVENYNNTPQLTINDDKEIRIDGGWLKATPDLIDLGQFVEDSNFYDVVLHMRTYNECATKKLERKIRHLEKNA